MRAPVWAHNTIALLMMMTIVTKLTMMLMTVHVMMPMINKYLNDDKVHSLAAMEAGIVTMALTNPLQVIFYHYQHQNGKTFGTFWWMNSDNNNHPKWSSDCVFCEQHLRNILQVLRTRMVLCSQVTEKDIFMITGDFFTWLQEIAWDKYFI